MMLNYAREAYENKTIYTTYPNVFNTSNTGTTQDAFSATNAGFMLSAGCNPIIPIMVEVHLTAIPGATTNWQYAIAIDTTQRYSGQAGASNQLRVAAVSDPPAAVATCLTNGALTGGTSWDVAGDYALAADAATYTHLAGAGTLTQRYDVMGATKTLIQPNKSAVLTCTTSATAGAGMTAFLVGGTLLRENQVFPGFTGTAVTNGTYIMRVRFGPNPPANDSTFGFLGTSGAAAVTTIDTLSLVADTGANSQALAYYGSITCTAASTNVSYIGGGFIKSAALATNDRVIFDFGRGLRTPPAATPFVVPVGPCQIPADGSLVIHMWSTSAAGGSPTTLAHARWIE